LRALAVLAIVPVLSMTVPALGTATAGATRRQQSAFGVQTVKLVLVDRSRATPATPTEPPAKTRTLRTTVRFPDTPNVHRLPLIVLAHGLNGDPEDLEDLSDTWARAGFVVALPRFPRTNVGADGKAVLADVADYPADLTFAVTQLLARSASTTPGPLQGRIDPEHIGAAGVSLGGMAIYGLTANSCCADPRVDAAILMAAVRPPFPRGHFVRPKIPVMLVHGDADTGYRYSKQVYPELGSPKWFITLRGGRHGPPFEDPPDEFDGLVRATTTSFWQRYLRGDRSAADRLVREVNRSASGATLQHT
jgi:poly(3-hydroxybutyrate) depolymerase